MSRWSPFLTVLALSLASQACSSADEANADDENGRGPSAPSERYTLSFSEPSLTLQPGESTVVSVQVVPAAVTTVRLSLVRDVGDGFLDTGVVTTDDTGSASFSLTAPTAPRSFGVLATAGTSSAELPVTVDDDVTNVVVAPIYLGPRKIDSWIATVKPGAECEDEGPIFEDGTSSAESTIGGPKLKKVPVGVKLRVTVRAGHFAGGCANTTAYGLSDHLVFVNVTDRPLELGGANIKLKLGLDSGDGWALAWSDVIDTMVDAFVARKSDSAALLDAIYQACPPASAPQFVHARAKASWDVKLANEFGNLLGVGNLTHRLRSYLTSGVGADGSGVLEGTLTSGENPGGKARLAFSSIGGAAPAKASLSPSIDVTWTAGTGDRVLFGGAAEFQATLLAAALGQAVAVAQVPSATTFPEALAESLSCKEVARVLVGSAGGEFAYGACGEECVVSLCGEALAAMWSRVLAAPSPKSKLELSASGAVKVLSDAAKPLDFQGTWVGTTTIGGRQASVSGAARGTTTRTSVP